MTKQRAEVEPAVLPAFPFQLADAYLYEATVARVEDPAAKMGDKPTLEIRRASISIQEEDLILVVVIGAKVGIVYRDGHRLEIDCAAAGHFRSQDPIKEPEGREFADHSALVLIYPYLRASVGELGRMTGIEVPVLPTLDVAGTLAALRDAGTRRPSRGRRKSARQAEAEATL